MSAQDEIGPVGYIRKLPNWRIKQLAREVKVMADAAAHHAGNDDVTGMMAARGALSKIARLLAEDGD
jgi:hypothetical protein